MGQGAWRSRDDHKDQGGWKSQGDREKDQGDREKYQDQGDREGRPYHIPQMMHQARVW